MKKQLKSKGLINEEARNVSDVLKEQMMGSIWL